MTAVNIIWFSAIAMESFLAIYFWAQLRALFPLFILYLMMDVGCALILAGILFYDSRYYGDAWIGHGFIVSGLELLISIEAIRRMNKTIMYHPRTLVFVLSVSFGLALIGAVLLDSPRRWPHEMLEPITWFRAGLQMWLGVSLWFLWIIPCRKGQRWTAQGKQMLMLAVYLLVNCVESFSSNHLWATGTGLSGSLTMSVSLGIFSLWCIIIRGARISPCME